MVFGSGTGASRASNRERTQNSRVLLPAATGSKAIAMARCEQGHLGKGSLSPSGSCGGPSCAVLACYVDSPKSSERPFIVTNSLSQGRANLAAALVAAEVESHGRRGSRRCWQRNDANCQGAATSESPSVELRAFVRGPEIRWLGGVPVVVKGVFGLGSTRVGRREAVAGVDTSP